jgi:integrase
VRGACRNAHELALGPDNHLISELEGQFAVKDVEDFLALVVHVRGRAGLGRHQLRSRRTPWKHELAYRPQLWLGVNNRGPLTTTGIYQIVVRRGEECGVKARPHRFRHHFSYTWLDQGGAEGDLMELSGWSSPRMLRRYGASSRGARARRNYDLIMNDAL